MTQSPAGDQLSQCRATLIFWTVQDIRLLTVSTDSTVSLADGRLLTRIWNATVRRHPAEPDGGLAAPSAVGGPSGDIANPDGSSATQDESPPFITRCMAGMSTGAYTTNDPDASVQVS